MTRLEKDMQTLDALTQFVIVLNDHHFAALALIALVAVARRRRPKD